MSIDAEDLRILHHVEHACSQTGVEWMLVGALARDIHLIEIAGIVPSRATNDVLAARTPSIEVIGVTDYFSTRSYRRAVAAWTAGAGQRA